MYALIFTYSFDGEIAVYLYDTLEEAKEALYSSVLEEVRIDREENGLDTDFYIGSDRDYARISNRFWDREDVTVVRIGTVYG